MQPVPLRMDFAVRLSLLYAGIFTAIGVQTPFLPLWLTAKGLDAPMIGALLATGTAARLIAVPLGTRAADGFSSPGIPIMVAAFVAALSVTALAFAGHVATMFALFAALTGAWAVVLPVAESHALRILTLRGRHYGPVRLWGSVSFIAANLGAGWLLTMMAPGELIWTIVAGYWLGTAAAVVVALGDARESHPVQPPPSGPNRIDRRVVLVLAASSLVQASHSQFYGFGSLQWTAAGFSSLQIGMLWAVSVAVEIALFASAARLPAPLRVPQTLLLLGAASATLRWTLMAFDPPFALLPWLQLLHGLSFGATHLAAIYYVAGAAAPGRAASAQGLLAWTNGLVMAAAMMAAGFLYKAHGAAAYGAMAMLAAAGAVCAIAATRVRHAG